MLRSVYITASFVLVLNVTVGETCTKSPITAPTNKHKDRVPQLDAITDPGLVFSVNECSDQCDADDRCGSYSFERKKSLCTMYEGTADDGCTTCTEQVGVNYYPAVYYEDTGCDVDFTCDDTDGWITNDADGTCYKEFKDNLPWGIALMECQKLGASLMKIDTEEKKSLVTGSDETWIGGYVDPSTDLYKWTLDESLVTDGETFWDSGEGDIDSAKCILVKNEVWEVEDCKSDHDRYFCEKAQAVKLCSGYEDGWVYFNNSCYHYGDDDHVSWITCSDTCVEMGGYVTTINSIDEMLLHKLLSGDDHNWTGYNDIDIEGTFIWNETGSEDGGIDPPDGSDSNSDDDDVYMSKVSGDSVKWELKKTTEDSATMMCEKAYDEG